MRTATIDERRLAARINLVNEHMRAENAHDFDRTMAMLISENSRRAQEVRHDCK
jgi:hypothetical protein